ncbi:ABC transporter ATP-binding protein [Tessaracoccus sp. OS52]|uniref:ABC transporter ATP-binding protein n=1 Tax=Tessaracoccus sp. OS52 TaxID=2886691 RepID=UPI001D10747F|nr:ABC transporter ATP-binding protein [Tessaracoccus sp. OS52]MCC2592062.1 ABC transporter ATP-binding protein [Tessaracoccus sp. OS52]
MSNAVSTSRLTKRFGKVLALDHLGLDIPEGSIFGVIGPNGAGKTTLMRLLLDILRPTSGHAEVLGQDPRAGGKRLRGRIGYLPGEFRVSPRLTGNAHVKFWSEISPQRDSLARARDFAERLDLDLSRPASKLSKGNKQKLGVVQAFMHKPELLILDEPTSGLDPLIQQTFLGMVREAHAEGATVFLSSHILSEVEQVADAAAILRSGRVVREAPITELRATAVRRLRAVVRAASTDEVTAAAQRCGLDLAVEPAGDGEVRVTGMVEGRANDVVALLGAFEVVDLVLSEPDLEETVLEIYSETDEVA